MSASILEGLYIYTKPVEFKNDLGEDQVREILSNTAPVHFILYWT